MQIALSQFYGTHLSRFFKREKCLCFHCGESMRKDAALMATFQQVQQPVCCHGCLAVLNAIEQNGLIEDYLQAKQLNESTIFE
ncbi:heavy metal translocating P-type ATPase metal-binding domain-containing protein [Undibacterium sp. Ji22W]|uniref:heavy metal translocating P-type ATPase metal-binding domain-containing protein n=1 Tax=Undibacterium sp. Ji22W TaxID=3413038 RepID=UPI003BEF9C50